MLSCISQSGKTIFAGFVQKSFIGSHNTSDLGRIEMHTLQVVSEYFQYCYILNYLIFSQATINACILLNDSVKASTCVPQCSV